MAEPLRWHRYWTREGRDPLAVFAMREDGLAEWSPEQVSAWRSLGQDGESLPNTLRRVAREAVDACAARGWVDTADQSGLTDELIFGLAKGAFAWSTLRPSSEPELPAATFYEASLRLGDRLLREALERGDEAEARRLGVPPDVLLRARQGEMPPPLAAMADEFDAVRRRGWMRISLQPLPEGPVAYINPSPWAEPVSGGFDLPSFRHAARLAMLAAAGSGPDVRVSLVNSAGTLLVLGLPFDSPRGLGVTASLAAILLGEAGQTARVLSLGAPATREQIRAAYLDFPDASRPQAGRLEPVRWREAALAALDLPEPWDGMALSGESDPAVECLLGGAARGLGAVLGLAGRDGQAGLRAIGYDQIQLEQAREAASRGTSPDFLSEEQAQVLRGAIPSPWGQILPQAQLRRALDLRPLIAGPVDAVAGAEAITPELRQLALDVSERGGASSVVLFGRPSSVQEALVEPASSSTSGESPRLSLCHAQDGSIGFSAPGATSGELALIQALLASNVREGAFEALPDDDSLAGQLKRELDRLFNGVNPEARRTTDEDPRR